MTLAYDRAGRGEPLVLLHPLGADRGVWRPVLDRLAASRDVVTVDLPGFGDSPALGGGAPPDPPALARAVAGLLDALGLRDAHVAGNSLGGWVALELALLGRARTVTGIGTAGLWARPLAPKPQVARRVARLAAPALPALLRTTAGRRLALGGVVAHPERVPPADAADLVRAYARATGFTAVNRAMRAGRFARIDEVRVPVTLAWPQYDRMVTRPRSLPARIRHVEIPDAGHVPMWDAPAAVADTLLRASRTREAVA